jgi:phosphohistidine phosphatase SixA
MIHRARLALLTVLLLAPAAFASAQQAVFVVRHGEKISNEDERLTDAGKARGERLARMLKDSGVAAVYSTDTDRTRGTAKPLADARGLAVQIYDQPATVVAAIRSAHARDVVVVVGHSNTVPKLLAAFGCAEAVTIADDEYDNLFLVLPKSGAAATLIRLRY